MSEEKIKLKSTRFGEMEIPVSSVITFPFGLIGFPDAHRFTMLDYNPPFSWLHAIDQIDLAFVVVNGAEFGEGYKFSVPYGDRDIDLVEGDDIAIINLVSVRTDPTMTTVNLKAPVIVNLKNMKARQIVLDDQRFPTRLPLWEK